MYGQSIYGLLISVCTGYNEQSVSVKSSLFYFCMICNREIINYHKTDCFALQTLGWFLFLRNPKSLVK